MAEKDVKQIMAEFDRQRGTLRNLLRTDSGKEALKYLAAKYGGDVFVKGDDSATLVRVGERRVVDYLIELQGEE